MINPEETMDYRTRGGAAVRLLCSDAEGLKPFVFLIEAIDGSEYPAAYPESGRHLPGSTEHPADIVRATPPDSLSTTDPFEAEGHV